MKKVFSIALMAVVLFTGAANAQKPSPATTATGTLANGTVVTINYSAPALKGRTIGKDVEPMSGKVWRAGANEATVFEVSKDVTINGKTLPAGKYGFFTIDNGSEWTLIFNKTWKQWGAFNYKEADDQLRVNVKPTRSGSATERLTYTVQPNGEVSLNWGTLLVSFAVK
ncbi:MAG TPA: DUF2911 domain-containing protein [Sediminibacterium sp.]|nr:DUF2911 domain-containing protein [Sediminibacterium sp.]